MGSSPRFGNVLFAALGGRSPARLQGRSPDPTTACGHAACASILAAALTLACFTPGVLAPPTAQARPAPSLRSTPARAMPPGGAAVRSSAGSAPADEARGWAAPRGTPLGSGAATPPAPDSFTPLDFLGHEFGHRWLAYVYVDSAGFIVPALLGRAYQHWNFFFDCDASIMEGCGWTSPAPDSFRTDSVTVGYGRVDRYLMGLVSKAETDSFFVVNAPTAFNPSGVYNYQADPFVGLGCRGRATWWHVSDIEAANGPRVPDAAHSPHAFRLGLVLVTAHGNAATSADLAKLEAIRSAFGPYFAAATRYRGSVDCSLESHAGRVCIVHTPLLDLESTSQARTVGAHVFISQAGIPIALGTSY